MKIQGIKKDTHFTYNGQSNVIKFFNGSEILLKDLAYYPSDPNYDELGSLELTLVFIDEVNQIPKIAWQIVKSRIRYKLDEYNLIPKILGTCNPSKNYIYTDFYKPEKLGTIEPHKKFIQALVTDNPFISKHYIENLKSLPKPQRDRLLYGIWESDDPLSLIKQESIISIFDNNWVTNLNDKYYITCDVARMGSDKAIIALWRGFEVVELYEYQKSLINELQDVILSLANKYKVIKSNIVADADGVGSGLVDNLKCESFVNNSKALLDENYSNLKTQCYYKLCDKINENSIYISAEISSKQKDDIIEELEQVKVSDKDSDNKLRIMSKADIKLAIGRSPDYADALMMRMYFEIKPKNIGYLY